MAMRQYNLDTGVQYTSYLVFNATDYGFIHTGAPTTAVNTIAISDATYNLPSVQVIPYQEDGFNNLTPHSQFTLDGAGVFLNSDAVAYGANILGVQTLKGSQNRSIDIIADSVSEPALKPNQILIASDNPDASAVVVGNYLVHFEGDINTPHSRLTRINVVQGGLTNSEYSTIPVGKTALLVTCQSEVLVDTVGGIKKVELYFPIDSWIDYLNIFTLDGFKLDSTKHVPNGTNERQNAILNGTLNGTNLFKALTDRDVINFRYIVDTFGNGIESGSKAIYTILASTRKNAFAILNAPSAKDFKDNTDPSFLDLTGSLSSRFISEGGDLAKNPTVRYSLPSQTQGASWGGILLSFYYC